MTIIKEKCAGSAKYKGKVAPTCGCQACHSIYLELCIKYVESAGLLVLTQSQLEDAIDNCCEPLLDFKSN